MKTVRGWAWAALLVLAVAQAACGGEDDDSAPGASDQNYDEGSVRMEIETLDTGLLKGHSYATAADGWRVKEIHVTAVDEKEQSWPVIEIPEAADGNDATLFFEVTIQELPRGEQVTVTTVSTFEDGGGVEVERTATDVWPP